MSTEEPIALTENAFGPAPSGFVTWLGTGEAVGMWRQEGSCGELETIGVYRFRPLEQPRQWFTTKYGFAVW